MRKYVADNGKLGFSDKIQFGIEIEAFNVNTSRNITNLRRNMSERFKGVFTGNERVHKSLYHSRESNKFFRETLSSAGKPYKKANFLEESLVGQGGAEIVSPILHDNEHDWESLGKVCEHMQKYPGRHGNEVVANEKCGAHVHFDSKVLSHEDPEVSKQMMGNFLQLWAETEELIYKMCNDKNDPIREGAINNKLKGINRLVYNSHIVKGMAAPIGKKILKQIEEGTLRVSYKKFGILKQVKEKMLGKSVKRYSGLNLTNLGNPNKNTIEFRISNGSLDPNILKQNVFLYGSLLETARDLTLEPEKYKDRLEMLYKTDVTEGQKADAFLDLIIEDEEDRKIYKDRWESVKDAKVFENNHKKGFAKDRFKKDGFAQIARRTPTQMVKEAFGRIEQTLKERLEIQKPIGESER